jgi:hypothetical protein
MPRRSLSPLCYGANRVLAESEQTRIGRGANVGAVGPADTLSAGRRLLAADNPFTDGPFTDGPFTNGPLTDGQRLPRRTHRWGNFENRGAENGTS